MYVVLFINICARLETEGYTESLTELKHVCICQAAPTLDSSKEIRDIQNESTENCMSNTEHRGTLRCIHGDGYLFLISLCCCCFLFLQSSAHVVL